jgi:hypothetical protein
LSPVTTLPFEQIVPRIVFETINHRVSLRSFFNGTQWHSKKGRSANCFGKFLFKKQFSLKPLLAGILSQLRRDSIPPPSPSPLPWPKAQDLGPETKDLLFSNLHSLLSS